MKKNYYFWIVGIVGFIIDQFTKFLIVKLFAEEGNNIPLLSGIFHLTYVRNRGAAFGLFQGAGWLVWLSLSVSLGLMIFAWRGTRLQKIEQFSLGFILAGALGNGIDRLLFGYVVDFLHFPFVKFPVLYQSANQGCLGEFSLFNLIHFCWIEFPVFNFADVFINIGIICFLIAGFYPYNREGTGNRTD